MESNRTLQADSWVEVMTPCMIQRYGHLPAVLVPPGCRTRLAARLAGHSLHRKGVRVAAVSFALHLEGLPVQICVPCQPAVTGDVHVLRSACNTAILQLVTQMPQHLHWCVAAGASITGMAAVLRLCCWHSR